MFQHVRFIKKRLKPIPDALIASILLIFILPDNIGSYQPLLSISKSCRSDENANEQFQTAEWVSYRQNRAYEYIIFALVFHIAI